MKHLATILFSVIYIGLWAQSVSPVAVTSGNHSAVNGEYQNSFTIGQTVVQTFSNGDKIITNGFHQPSSTLEIIQDISDRAVCSGESVSFVIEAEGNLLSYQWQKDGFDIAGATDSILILENTELNDAATYVCIITSGSKSITSSEAILTVYALPAVNLGDDFTSCEGETEILTANTGFNFYEWSVADSTRNELVINSSGEYIVNVTDGNLCIGLDTINVVFNSIPEIPGSSDEFSCYGDNVPDLTSTGTDVIWYSDEELLTEIGTGTNYSTGQTEPGDYTYYLTQTVDGCTSAANTSTLSIIALPTIEMEDTTFVCDGNSLQIGISEEAGHSYSWTSDPVGFVDVISNPYVNPAEQTNYFLQVENIEYSCFSTDSILVNVYDNPVISLGNDTSMCLYETVTLSPAIEETDYQSYLWNDGSENWQLEVDTTGYYEVTVTSENGCTGSAGINIEVDVPYDEQEICVVSVNLANKNRVVWEPEPDKNIKSFKIYRKVTDTVMLGEVLFNDAGVYTDTTSQPSTKEYQYFISSVDSCENESELSFFHKTMLLSVSEDENSGGKALDWTPYVYEGGEFTFDEYQILRGESPDNLEYYDVAGSFGTRYIDINPGLGTKYYQVAGIVYGGCDPFGLGKEEDYGKACTNISDNGVPLENVNPENILLSTSSIDENLEINSVVGLFSTEDANNQDVHTYSFAVGDGDTDNEYFILIGDTLKTNAVFDFETQSTYNIRIRTTDNGTDNLWFEKTFVITINNANDAPIDISLSTNEVEENMDIGTEIGLLSTTDVDTGDEFTYTLVSGTGDNDNTKFNIENNILLTNEVLDFEDQSSYNIRIRTTDNGEGELYYEEYLIILALDVNDNPTDITLDSENINENMEIGSAVGLLQTVDQDVDNTHSYELVPGIGDTDNGSFNIDDNNNIITTEVFNYEVKNEYFIRLRTTDTGEGFLSFEKEFIISVNDVNDSPTDIFISKDTLEHGQNPNTTIGILSAEDEDTENTHSYSFISGVGDLDNADFEIEGDLLKTGESTIIDYFEQSEYSIRLQVTDSESGLFEKIIILLVEEPGNLQPTDIILDSENINENLEAGSIVGLLETTDQNEGDAHTYELVTGNGDTDNASFDIDENNNLITTEVFNYEDQNEYYIRLRTTDDGEGNLSFEEEFVITVNDINDVPTDINLTNEIIEHAQDPEIAIGILSAVDEDIGDTHSYGLISGSGDTDNAAFIIDGDLLKVDESTIIDYYDQNEFSILLQVTDSESGVFNKVFILTVEEPENNAPTDIALDSYEILENLESGTFIGLFSTVDPDEGDTHTYSLVSGNGDTDNESFTITTDSLLSAESFNYETQNIYHIRAKTTDYGGAPYEKELIINIIDTDVLELVENPEVTIYPNPTEDLIYFDFENVLNKDVTIQIINGIGQNIYLKEFDQEDLKKIFSFDLCFLGIKR